MIHRLVLATVLGSAFILSVGVAQEPRSPEPRSEFDHSMVQQLRNEASELVRLGRWEEAHRVFAKSVELRNRQTDGRPHGPNEGPTRAERIAHKGKRLEMLKIAGEHLKVGQFEDLAHVVMKKVEELEQDIRREKEEYAREFAQGDRQNPESIPREFVEQVHQQLRELRQENDRLRREIAELRERTDKSRPSR